MRTYWSALRDHLQPATCDQCRKAGKDLYEGVDGLNDPLEGERICRDCLEVLQWDDECGFDPDVEGDLIRDMMKDEK